MYGKTIHQTSKQATSENNAPLVIKTFAIGPATNISRYWNRERSVTV